MRQQHAMTIVVTAGRVKNISTVVVSSTDFVIMHLCQSICECVESLRKPREGIDPSKKKTKK